MVHLFVIFFFIAIWNEQKWEKGKMVFGELQ